jgi:hypothetical protein
VAFRHLGAAVITIFASTIWTISASGPASAAPFPAPEPFIAPSCPGQTDSNPSPEAEPGNESPVNLREVFGARLEAYNAGHVVPLYDYAGYAYDSYPPLCGVRYVPSLGEPVAEWMFCTDLDSKVCGDMLPDGSLAEGTDRVDPLDKLPVNPKLSADQEKIIAYLVQHGYSYTGVGDQSWGGTTFARSDGSSAERAALQTLIWCVSDWDASQAPSESDTGFTKTCQASMNSTEQARILSMIPQEPTVSLELSGEERELTVDDTASFQLRTNLFNQPISLRTTASGDVNLTVCEGSATLTGQTITVSGSGEEPALVTLCATSTVAGEIEIEATGRPTFTEHVGWNQSPTLVDGDPCQVFAAFYENQSQQLDSRASATFVSERTPTPTPTPEPTTDPTPEPTSTPDTSGDGDGDETTSTTSSRTTSDASSSDLPEAGAPRLTLALAIAAGLLAVGSLLIARSRKRTAAHRR